MTKRPRVCLTSFWPIEFHYTMYTTYSIPAALVYVVRATDQIYIAISATPIFKAH